MMTYIYVHIDHFLFKPGKKGLYNNFTVPLYKAQTREATS